MAIDLGVVVVAYNQPRWLELLFASIRRDSHVEPQFMLFLHSNDPETTDACQKQVKHRDTVLRYYSSQTRSLAKSWNEGLIELHDIGLNRVLIMNDDMAFQEPSGVGILAQDAIDHQEHFAIFATGSIGRPETKVQSHNFGCFILNPIGWERIGCFDENYFPAVYEDLDYATRATFSGLQSRVSTAIVYHGGSRTFRDDPKLCERRRVFEPLNRAYYQRKWGHEVAFLKPFDDASLNYYIAPSQRHAPYPGYSRTDLPKGNN